MVKTIQPEHFTEETDPFRVRLAFSLSDKVQMGLVFLLLVPIRVVIALVCLVLAALVSCIGLIGMDMNKPIDGWRKYFQRASCVLGQMCCRCVGFHRVKITGARQSKHVAPVIVVAPHSTFLDALAIFWCGLPFFVSRVENKSIPLMGKCIEFAQTIFVRREVRENRQQTVAEITRRVKSSENWSQFLIFPEGTTSNRKALMSFKPGGFLPGKTVQPLLIRYKNKHDTVSWTWDQPHGFALCFLYTLCQWNNTAELHFLDPYVPSDEEVKDPVLFANNVRKVMAEALDIPICDMTFEDIKQRYEDKKEE